RNSLSGPWPWVRAEAAGAAVATASAAGIAMASTPTADVRSRRNLDDMDTSFRSHEGIADTLDTYERDERLNKPAECDIFAMRRAHRHPPGGRARLAGGVGDAHDLGLRRARPGALGPPPRLARFGQHVDRVVVGVLAGERQLVVGLDG